MLQEQITLTLYTNYTFPLVFQLLIYYSCIILKELIISVEKQPYLHGHEYVFLPLRAGIHVAIRFSQHIA